MRRGRPHVGRRRPDDLASPPPSSRSPGAMITARSTTRTRRPRSGDAASRTVVRGPARRPRRAARAHPHDHRDRQRALHHHDDEPGAPPPRRRVRGRHRVRPTAREQPLHPRRCSSASRCSRPRTARPSPTSASRRSCSPRRCSPATPCTASRRWSRRGSRSRGPTRGSSPSSTAASTSATSSCAGPAATRSCTGSRHDQSVNPAPARIRSLLFAPASKPDVLRKMPRSVPDARRARPRGRGARPTARPRPASTPATVGAELVADHPELAVYVRVNPVPTEWFADDVADGAGTRRSPA